MAGELWGMTPEQRQAAYGMMVMQQAQQPGAPTSSPWGAISNFLRPGIAALGMPRGAAGAGAPAPPGVGAGWGGTGVAPTPGAPSIPLPLGGGAPFALPGGQTGYAPQPTGPGTALAGQSAAYNAANPNLISSLPPAAFGPYNPGPMGTGAPQAFGMPQVGAQFGPPTRFAPHPAAFQPTRPAGPRFPASPNPQPSPGPPAPLPGLGWPQNPGAPPSYGPPGQLPYPLSTTPAYRNWFTQQFGMAPGQG